MFTQISYEALRKLEEKLANREDFLKAKLLELDYISYHRMDDMITIECPDDKLNEIAELSLRILRGEHDDETNMGTTETNNR